MIIKWLRQRRDQAIHRKYDRLNQTLAEQGSDARWIEVIKGEWYCVSTAHLEKPYPRLGIKRKSVSVSGLWAPKT